MNRSHSCFGLLTAVVFLLLVLSSAAFPRHTTTSAASSAPRPSAHIFLVAGQSNTVGPNIDPFTAEDAVDERIWQLAVCSANGTSLPPAQSFLNVSADPLMPCDGGHVSFPRSFARALLPSLPADDVVVLVPTGISGTGFFDNVWNAYTGSGFVRAVEQLRVTWRLLHEDAHFGRFNISWAGVLWHQGEV